MKTFIAPFIVSTVLIFSNCTTPQNNSPDKLTATANDAGLDSHSSDSVTLLALIKNMLLWHSKEDTSQDFKVTHKPNDSVYTGIDWPYQRQRLADISNSKFFSKAFLDNYQDIAVQLDKDLKVNPTKYYVGDLPPYEGDEDYWCKCQDTPDTSWEKSLAYLTLKELKITSDSASFKWSWGSFWGKYWADAIYSVRAKKENGTWKISYLEEFDSKNFTWK